MRALAGASARTRVGEPDDADVRHHPQQQLQRQLLPGQSARVVLPV
jgi:hypothetical protein